jgi:KaiC/GvpD/RAD55 family RecA-like ATPase
MLSADIQDAIMARSDLKPKRKRERVYFRCPRHEDNEPSAWTGGGAWGCFSCGFEEPITTLAAEIGVELHGNGATGYTLEDYADQKAFSAQLLRSLGVATAEVNGRSVVRIPYFDVDGNELRARFRSRSGDKWWEGKNRPIHPYGLDRLPDLKPGDAILVVEGESDCHAAWSHSVPAFGIPGATAWKSEWAKHLEGLEVFVWEEPDQGGAQFVKKVTADIPSARIISDAGVKDVADLHKKSDDFAATVRGLMATAPRKGTPKAPVAIDAFLGQHIEDLLAQKLRAVDAAHVPFPIWARACCDEGGKIGIARGWHIIAAARTGVGKSIIALNMAAKGIQTGERVCFVSLEMDQRQLETRLMAMVAGMNVWKLEKGEGFDRVAFKKAAKRFAEIHEQVGGIFYSNRDPIHNLQSVVDAIRYSHEVHGCRFFIVDYLQLAGNPNDPESITAVSHAVRQQAKDLQVVTVGLSQFNRQTSASPEQPTIQGLMGGSALENDADQVLLIDHSRMQIAPAPVDGWHGHVLLAKNRHGPLVDIPIEFNKATLQMRELMPDEAAHMEAA